jgi:transcriptional regulator with XRE-family HTH domain
MAKTVISGRLRRFGKERFGTMALFASELGISASALSSNYLSGRSIPGGEMMLKLLLLGCDINWLLLGVGRAPNPSKEERDRWIEYCEAQAKYWREYGALQEQAEQEMKQLMERAMGEPSNETEE